MILNFNVKQLRGRFINKEAILTPLQRAQYRGLREIGALTRSLAKRSMKKKRRIAKPSEYPAELKELTGQGRDKFGRFTKGVEDIQPIPMIGGAPGKPPAVGNGLLKRHIYFEADPVSMSVVTGVAALPGIKQKATPEMMERGGVRVEEVGEWRKFYKNGRPMIRLVNRRSRPIRYQARSFVASANQISVSRLVPDIWENSLK